MSTPIFVLSIVAGVLLLAVAALAYRELRYRRRERELIAREQALRSQVAEKASASAPLEAGSETDQETAGDLTHSGALSVQEEIDRCVASGLWDEAVKWSLHAIDARPDRHEFKVKLAEIYSWSGNREEFTQLFEELHEHLPEDDALRRQLFSAARETIPDHPLLQR